MVSARDEGGRLCWRATKALAADNEGGRAGVSQYAPVGRVLPYGHSGRTARRSAEQQRAEHQCGSHGRRAAAVAPRSYELAMSLIMRLIMDRLQL